MALYTVQSNGFQTQERAYHIGDRNLMLKELLEDDGSKHPMKLVSIGATGDELEFIRKNFTGIPMRLNTVSMVAWNGELASFIAENW